MRRHLAFAGFLAGLTLALGVSAGATSDLHTPEVLRRFALVIGANRGGEDRVQLRYAVSDARALMGVLNKIGGIFPMDSILITEPNREAFLAGLSQLRDKILQAKTESKKIEVIFYFSGHSDEESILLSGEKIGYREIRNWIDKIPADVRIAILDSCSSGAFTRLKGGKPKAPFLADASYDMKGYAFMTSSSSDEVSQESDRLRSSIFTHNLMAGLRGAADVNRDGRVTLNEAYQFAYDETLSKTEKTLYGSQHPNYNIQMSGTGDVVMTDIRNSSALLVLDPEIQGRLFIRDLNGRLVMELHKPGGRPMQIGLEEGDYSVLTEQDGKIMETRLHLSFGQETRLDPSQFSPIARERTARRGKNKKTPPGDNSEIYTTEKIAFILYPKAEGHETTVYRSVFSLLGNYSAGLQGISAGLGPGIVREDARGLMFSLAGNNVGGDFYGIQIGEFFNRVGGDLTGIQISNGVNLAHDLTGIQASLVNLSGDLKGIQLALANSAGKVHGTQFALVNLADDCDGVQCGLINIAQHQTGASIGLVNLAENGQTDFPVWADNLSGLNTGVRFRINHFYSLLAVGGDPGRTRIMDQPLAVSIYLGGHLDVGRFYFETDFGFRHMDPLFESKATDNRAFIWRTLGGWNLSPRFSLFAGTGAAFAFEVDNQQEQLVHSQLLPLVLGGVQFTF